VYTPDKETMIQIFELQQKLQKLLAKQRLKHKERAKKSKKTIEGEGKRNKLYSYNFR